MTLATLDERMTAIEDAVCELQQVVKARNPALRLVGPRDRLHEGRTGF